MMNERNDIVFDRAANYSTTELYEAANYSTTGLHEYRTVCILYVLCEVNVGSFGFNDVTSTMCVRSYVMMNC